MIRLVSVAATVAAALLLSGCVPAADPSPPPSPSTVPATTTPTPPAPTDEPVAWTPSGVPADPSAYANPDGGIVFSAPSGNLHCGYSEWGGLWWWCLADELSVSLPPDPAGRCVGEYVGGAAIVPNGIGVIGADPDARPESFCAGSDESPVLPYGSSISYRDMGCESSDEGMTCRSLLTGAGFRLSRSDYELF